MIDADDQVSHHKIENLVVQETTKPKSGKKQAKEEYKNQETIKD
jgi:hypothetical protein